MENPRGTPTDHRLKELSLLLLYLSGWEEDSRKTPGEKIFRSWKGYKFEVLNELEKDNSIVQYGAAKSVTLTPDGRKLAERIKQKYA